MTAHLSTGDLHGTGRMVFSTSPNLSVSFLFDEIDERPSTLAIPGDWQPDISIGDRRFETNIGRIGAGFSAESGVVPQFRASIERYSKDDPIASVVFLCINFPDTRTTLYSDGSGHTRHQFSLEHEGFIWEVDSLPDFKDRVSATQESGGRTITHVGRLRKADGTKFLVSEVRSTLDSFDLFMSFAAGRRVASVLTVPEQSDTGFPEFDLDSVNSLVDRLKAAPNWFRDGNHVLLTRVWPGFAAFLSSQGDWFRRLILYYVAVNRRENYIDFDLITICSALEMLSWVVLVELSETLSQSAANKLSLSDMLRLLLKINGIDNSLPKSYVESRALLDRRGSPMRDGPAALSAVRNILVHPTAKNLQTVETLANKLYWEVFSLGTYYIENMVLLLSDYSGDFSVRISQRSGGSMIRKKT